MSGLASALSNGPGILNPIAGTTTQSGVRQPLTSTGTEKPCEVLTALRTPTIRTSKRGTASPDISTQLIRGLERVENGGQSQVENTIESQHIDSHGKNDIKDGILATRRNTHRDVILEQADTSALRRN